MSSRLIVGLTLLAVAASAKAEGPPNTLTAKEKQSGWRLLFDGATTKGWMTIRKQPVPERNVQQESLNPHPCEYMLVYDSPIENYLLSIDFKISPKCNSGIFVRTFSLQARAGRDIGYNGIEIAIDDTKTAGFHDTGAIYDLVKPTKNAMKPVGEWNRVIIRSDGNVLSVKLNGEDVSRMNLANWSKPNLRPDGSSHKFDVAYKDHARKGYIGLQDHGGDCWYRNIKLKPLP